jgi:hypothetical protein
MALASITLTLIACTDRTPFTANSLSTIDFSKTANVKNGKGIQPSNKDGSKNPSKFHSSVYTLSEEEQNDIVSSLAERKEEVELSSIPSPQTLNFQGESHDMDGNSKGPQVVWFLSFGGSVRCLF